VDETDEVLVRKAQLGSREAFEELVRRTARLLFSRLYLDTGNAHRAEDLVQETLLTAWKSIGQMTEPSGFRPWLMKIARSTAIDANRRDSRKKRTSQRAPMEFAEEVADGEAGPAQKAESEESRQQVLASLRALPEEYRQPLTLRYIGGADYETISRQLGLTNGSLRGLLNRGIARLREQMRSREPAGFENDRRENIQ
jgi:RNA polymerase sigma-70 factor (ECF subfamily)